ncbi:MAG: SMC family ATPase [Candidatus Bathyarchaeota archaeon]|nr:MAG: SMC family ATPase [Candidatus Bathyarchaeota archaeon]
MIIKSLKLENIRSYEKAAVDFPPGTILFEGDVGSGKSTILLAIEFALFGLGDQLGASLLRAGTKEGSVTLTFEVEGQEYEAHRSLVKKGKGVQQGEGHVKSSEGEKHLSPSELKQETLDILKFNEPPNPKAQSVIYRYAVYTPQEEMKAILWTRADQRLQTLRKAFMIEDYRVSAENATNLARVIDKKIAALDAQAADLENRKKLLKECERSIEENQKNLEKRADEEKNLREKLKETADELKSLRETEKKLKKAEAEIPLLTTQIQEANDRIEELTSDSNELSLEVTSGLQPRINELSKVENPTEKEPATLEKELKELRDKSKELRKLETTIEAKIRDYQSVEENKLCPTCDREADPQEFKEKIRAKHAEKNQASQAVGKCEETIKDTETLMENLRAFNEAQKELNDLSERLKKNQERIEKNKKGIEKLEKSMETLQKKLDAAREEYRKIEKISQRVNELNNAADRLQVELDGTIGKVAEAKTTIRELKTNAQRFGGEIQEKEKQKKLSGRLGGYHIWLKDYFIPTLDNIEKHVMITINQEFNRQFEKWFNLLVEDPGKTSRVDEDFTPIVEQDGYEQPVSFLSGGEKTSVALAYRLALNSIVQKVSVGMKSNLLILDEPTDGFSKEQLFKVREILNELKCPQVVMVSHERELESFADQVFRVEKSGGVSTIKAALT